MGSSPGIEQLDARPPAPDRLSRHTGLPPQGLLENLPPPQVAEFFRLVWARLRFATRDEPLRSLLVTSGGPGHGKTLVAASLAVAAAESGMRGVLVDADLRHPSLHEIFFHGRSSVRLTDLLSGEHL